MEEHRCVDGGVGRRGHEKTGYGYACTDRKFSLVKYDGC